MHEYSIVSDLVLLCEENAQKHNANKILKVIIELGERSGVESSLLKIAFDTFKEESTYLKDSSLEILHKNVELRCKSCNVIFKAEGLEYGICKFCSSNDLEIVSGMELNLLRLEME